MTERVNPFEQGAKAFHAGLAASANPYDEHGEVEYIDFLRWRFAFRREALEAPTLSAIDITLIDHTGD